MKLSLLVLSTLATASAFVATPMRAPAMRPAAASLASSPTMVVDPTAVDLPSTLMAMQIPIPAYSPAKAGLMMFCNILMIYGMTIQGKGLRVGTSHDEMVESFGLTWLLAGTSLGHIVGAGAILGCTTAGFM